MKIGEFGKITRTKLPDGRWEAICRYKGPDGVIRRAKRVSPAGERDRNGAKVEELLRDSLKELTTVRASAANARGALLSALLHEEMQRMRDNTEKFGARTMDSYNRVERVLTGVHKNRSGVECKDGHLGGLRANDVTVVDLEEVLRAVAVAHDHTVAKQARTLLMRVGKYLVKAQAWQVNMVREADLNTAPDSKSPTALTLSEARELLEKLNTSDAPLRKMIGGKREIDRTVSEFARSVDLVDPMTVALFTGLRRGELLGLVWDDFDADAKTLAVRHHVIRAGKRDGSRGTTLIHEAKTKTKMSERLISLPDAVVELLERRRGEYDRGERVRRTGVADVIFANTAGGLRDPDTFGGQWRRVRDELGYESLGLHGLRKTTASILKELGYSSVAIADIMGHAQVSMTEDVYYGRDRPHPEAASGLDAAFAAAV